MILVRREGIVSALRESIHWHASQAEPVPHAAELLAERFAEAVASNIESIARRLGSGVIWQHRPGCRSVLVKRPFDYWQILYRHPKPSTVELVDVLRRIPPPRRPNLHELLPANWMPQTA